MKVSTSRLLFIILVISVSGWACSSPSLDHWIEAVPQSTPVLVVLDRNLPVDVSLGDPLSVIAAQASSTNNAEILKLVSESGQSDLSIQAMAVIASNSDEWKPVWIISAPDGTAELASSRYSRPQTANGYNFRGNRIYMLFISESLVLFAVQAGDFMFVSESSYALEAFARTISGNEDSISIERSELTAGKWFLSFAYMDDLLATETAVRYRPLLNGVFDGSGVADLSFLQNGTGAEITGSMPVDSKNSSNLIRAFTHVNHRTIMDRYVSEDAALAAFYHGKTQNLPVLNEPAELDVYLSTREYERQRVNSSLGNHVAFVAFGSSGISGASEYAYVRQVERADDLRTILDEWVQLEMAQREGDRYIVDSIVLSWLISGGLSEMGIFHLSFDNDILIATQRPALISKLLTDKERRRTLYYTEAYLNARASYPDEVSAFIYTKNESLIQFLQPVLNQTQSTWLILDQFDAGSLALTRSIDGTSVNLHFKSYQLEQTSQPYDDRWLVRLDGTELTGYPILSDIIGSSRPEILVSTQGGTVAAIASDGTVVFRVSTGTDVPVGSPMAYDWYANNQMAVIQGAGNKIYGWSNNGTALPGFPITLSETLSAPILVTDLTRNGIAEIIAATSDRQLHVLNQRGENINGWPQSLNASIRNKPQVVNWLGGLSVVAYSENVLFAFETNGVVKSGFPLFNRAPFRGDFFIYDDFLIAGSADGTILSIGRGTLFPVGSAPVLSAAGQSAGQLTTQGVKLAEAGLVLRPELSTQTIRIDSTNSITEPMIFAQTDAGFIFGINMQAELRFTQSLGQPALTDHAPLIVDIDNDGQSEITGIASFGRLYAWQLLTGERYFEIPTNNLHRPVFSDINGNGSNELIAATQDGLRAWTINR